MYSSEFAHCIHCIQRNGCFSKVNNKFFVVKIKYCTKTINKLLRFVKENNELYKRKATFSKSVVLSKKCMYTETPKIVV